MRPAHPRRNAEDSSDRTSDADGENPADSRLKDDPFRLSSPYNRRKELAAVAQPNLRRECWQAPAY